MKPLHRKILIAIAVVLLNLVAIYVFEYPMARWENERHVQNHWAH
jgi:hypothetical protein